MVLSLQAWFDMPLGQALLQAELELCAAQLKEIYGYYALQISGHADEDWIHPCAMARQYHAALSPSAIPTISASSLVTSPTELPFPSDMFDLVCLPHCLEQVAQPQHLLAEIHRVLVPNGKLMILGFNPLSYWWLWQRIHPTEILAPICALGSIGLRRLSHWLAGQDYQLLGHRTFFYVPPLNNAERLARMAALSHAVAFALPCAGAVYAVLASKQSIALTPRRLQFNYRKVVAKPERMAPSGTRRSG